MRTGLNSRSPAVSGNINTDNTKDDGSARNSGGTDANTLADAVSGNKNADNTKDDGSAHKSGGTGANTNNDINANDTISYSM